MLLEVKKNLQKFNINKNDKLVLSISGGIDSMVLHDIISKIYIFTKILILKINLKIELSLFLLI